MRGTQRIETYLGLFAAAAFWCPVLQQIDDITKQLPPKVIEAVWASLTNARANATSAAATTSKTPEAAAPAAAAGGDRGLCSSATGEAIPAKGVGVP